MQDLELYQKFVGQSIKLINITLAYGVEENVDNTDQIYILIEKMALDNGFKTDYRFTHYIYAAVCPPPGTLIVWLNEKGVIESFQLPGGK